MDSFGYYILSVISSFVFSNLFGPPSIFDIFFILVSGLIGIDNMSPCAASGGSIRRFLSRLPVHRSDFPHRHRGCAISPGQPVG